MERFWNKKVSLFEFGMPRKPRGRPERRKEVTGLRIEQQGTHWLATAKRFNQKKIDSWLKVVQRYTQNRDVDWKIVNSAIGFLRKAIKVRRTSTVIFIKTMRSFAREKGKDLSPEYLLELERWVSSEQRKIEEIKEVCRQAEARHMRESLE